MVNLIVHPFFDLDTFSCSYVLANPGSGTCAVIDPVLHYDPESAEVSTAPADQIIEFVRTNGYIVEWLLETHVHEDRLSAGRYLKQHFICAQLGIGRQVIDEQARSARSFNIELATDGSQFDRLFADNDRICLGHSCGRVLHTPGHSAAGVTYVFDQFAFVGDTLFMPDRGTARCDLPGADAGDLYRSIRKILALPEDTRLLMCHDYASRARDYHYVSSVSEQRQGNVHLGSQVSEDDFVALRRQCDEELTAPRLLLPAVRANIAGGVLPGWQPEPDLRARHKAGAVA